MAKHIVSVHRRDIGKEAKGAIPIDKLKKYIAYCRQRVDPRLSEDAAATLRNKYVEFRGEMRRQQAESGKAAIPITVSTIISIDITYRVVKGTHHSYDGYYRCVN